MDSNLREFSHNTRSEILNQIQDQTFDLVIIGGGITGAGVFREVSLRGAKVLLLEAKDFAYGTSSRSTKLIHGGIRYLQNLHFHLVLKSLNERFILRKVAPHLVKPLEFLMPLYKDSPIPFWKIRIGLFLYDLLALFRSPRMHRSVPFLDLKGILTKGLKRIYSYFDYWTDDARLTLENIIDGFEAGGLALNYSPVTAVKKAGDGFEVEISKSIKVKVKKILNATGPDSDVTRGMIEGTGSAVNLAPTKGVHVVVPRERLALSSAVILNVPKDQRVAFVIPWETTTIIGTTDTFSTESQSNVRVTKEDVDYLLAYANHYFPEANLKEEDILSSWVGLRPLVKPETTLNAGRVSREEKIWFEPDNCLHMIGGKLTTYRKVSKKIADKFEIPGHSHTKTRPLPGGKAERYPFGSRFEIISRIESNDPHLSEPISARVSIKRSWIHYILKYECAIHLIDIMVRRLGIYYRFKDYGEVEALEILKIMKQHMPSINSEEELKNYLNWCNLINAFRSQNTKFQSEKLTPLT